MASGIVLNRSETLSLIRFFLLGTLLLFVLVGGSISLWEYTPLEKRFVTLLFFVGVLLVVLFIVARYVLLGFFQTKRSLDFLIRETLHELNVPLSVIKANLHMLQSHETDTKKRQRLNRIQNASEDLYRLYEDVEYYIRCEIRTQREEPFVLDETLLGIVEACKPLARETCIECEVFALSLLGDRRGFVKVISNLLHNALKYNQNNAPIRIYQEGNILFIHDQGIGMSEAELFLVFDRYYQADANKEGFGIGLSLVKAYCDASKILFSIASKKGEGTKVSLDLTRLIAKNAIIV